MKDLLVFKVGRALAVSALDMVGANPWSRIPASDFHTMRGIRQWLSVYIRSTHNPFPVSKKNGKNKPKEEMYVFCLPVKRHLGTMMLIEKKLGPNCLAFQWYIRM